MKIKILILITIVTVFLGCQVFRDKTIPEELIGLWETSEPRYEDCTFELKDEMIIFNNYPEYTNINYITDIEKSPEKDRVLYHIHYEDQEGQEFKLSLFYDKTADVGVIRFKNQKEIIWTKREG